FDDVIEKYELCASRVAVRDDHYAVGFIIMSDEMLTMAQARERFAKHLRINVPIHDGLPAWLQQQLSPYRGGECPVVVEFSHPEATGRLLLGEVWRVRPEQHLIAALAQDLDDGKVVVEY